MYIVLQQTIMVLNYFFTIFINSKCANIRYNTLTFGVLVQITKRATFRKKVKM